MFIRSALQDIAFIVVGVFGGLAKYLHTYLTTGCFSWNKLIASLFISGFTAYIAGKILSTYIDNEGLIHAFTGIAAVSGYELIKRLELHLNDILNLKRESRNTKNDGE